MLRYGKGMAEKACSDTHRWRYRKRNSKPEVLVFRRIDQFFGEFFRTFDQGEASFSKALTRVA
ncbi:MAG: hypothetical protein L0Z53_18860, partial [Acidobacteriales bacterium]|nr:hypothetical protein [Terriglobales bacterium]